MLINKPAKSEAAHEIPGLAQVAQGQLGAGVIFVDNKRTLTAITPQAVQLLGLKSAPPGGSPLSSLPKALQAVVKNALTSGKPFSVSEIELGTTINVTAVIVPQAGGKSGLILALNSCGSTRDLEEKLWRTDRLANIGTLAAGMAHEIKNALVPGKTFVDLLLERNRDTELVDVVRREMARIDAIVSRMLKFAGPDRPMTRSVSLHEILDHSLQLVQPHRQEKHISLNESMAAKPDLVRGDDHQLQQVFVNLFLNALEAMGENGTLTVSTEEAAAETSRPDSRARWIQITIADDGDGIAPEYLDRLFEPFFTTKPNGTGLGLPITRRIIEDHQGTVAVHSQPKKGTTFKIVLPAHDATTATS